MRGKFWNQYRSKAYKKETFEEEKREQIVVDKIKRLRKEKNCERRCKPNSENKRRKLEDISIMNMRKC